MSPSSVFAMLEENVSKPRFYKSLSFGETWKSNSMRIIPEEFLRSASGAIEHRVVFSVSWGNSWQLWLQRDKNGMSLWMTTCEVQTMSCSSHTKTQYMFIEVRIYKQDLHLFKEILSVPLLEAEPESEVLNSNPQASHEETPTSSFAPFASASSSASASGATQGSCSGPKCPKP